MTNNACMYVMLMDVAWRINKHGGVYKKGAVFPLQKPYQIAASPDWLLWWCCCSGKRVLTTWRKTCWQVFTSWPFWSWRKRFTANDHAAMESGLPVSTYYTRPIYVSQWNSEIKSPFPKKYKRPDLVAASNVKLQPSPPVHREWSFLTNIHGRTNV